VLSQAVSRLDKRLVGTRLNHTVGSPIHELVDEDVWSWTTDR